MKKALLLLLLAGCAPRSPAVSLGNCGAVALGPHMALTAGHCVDWQVGAKVLWEPLATVRVRAEAVTVAVDRERDLAWLASDALLPNAPRMRVGIEGEAIRAVAPVFGWRVSQGTLGRETSLGGQDAGGLCYEDRCATVVRYWETNLTIAPGWSGSPVLADSDGALVGAVVACQGEVLWAGIKIVKRCRPGFALVAGL